MLSAVLKTFSKNLLEVCEKFFDSQFFSRFFPSIERSAGHENAVLANVMESNAQSPQKKIERGFQSLLEFKFQIFSLKMQ